MKKDKKIEMPKVPKQSKDLLAEKKEQLKKLFPERHLRKTSSVLRNLKKHSEKR